MLQSEMAEGMVIVGYWRPVERGVHPGSSYLAVMEEDVVRAERGEHVALYVSEDMMADAGVGSKAEYLRVIADERRARLEREMSLPWPVADSLPSSQRAALAVWLAGGEVVARYCGSSVCRLCGDLNGSDELSRDGYVYPDGLSHYVVEHGCRVPGLPDQVWMP